MTKFDVEIFRHHIKAACQKALHEFQSGRIGQDAAIARIDGIFDGAFAAAKGLGHDLWAGEMMEVTREETAKAQREIFSRNSDSERGS